MYNDLFSIGPLEFHTYGLMIGIGIIAAYFMASRRANKKGLTETQINKIFGLVIFCVVFGFLSSKLLYIITVLPQLAAGTINLKESITGGWVIYGGLLGGILGGVIYCKVQKENFWLYADIAIPTVALAQGFGRIGCFFAGCCYGIETKSSWFYIMFSHSNFAPNNVHLIPTQLIMSAGDFILCILLLVYEKKRQKVQGDLVAIYLIIYSVGRFLVEYLRGDLIRGQVGILSTSQFIGLFTAAAGVIILIRLHSQKKTSA